MIYTGDYIPYNSYSPMQQNINLISFLTYKAIRLCSKVYLKDEILNVKNNFLNLGNLYDIVNS